MKSEKHTSENKSQISELSVPERKKLLKSSEASTKGKHVKNF